MSRGFQMPRAVSITRLPSPDGSETQDRSARVTKPPFRLARLITVEMIESRKGSAVGTCLYYHDADPCAGLGRRKRPPRVGEMAPSDAWMTAYARLTDRRRRRGNAMLEAYETPTRRWMRSMMLGMSCVSVWRTMVASTSR